MSKPTSNTPSSKSVLGKGLGALFNPTTAAPPAGAQVAGATPSEPVKKEVPKVQTVIAASETTPAVPVATPREYSVVDSSAAPKASGGGAQEAISQAASASGPEKKDVSSTTSGLTVVAVEVIKPNEFQPRRDFDPTELEGLSQSIKENGIIQPLVVRRVGEGYELIAGERRLRAAKLAGLKTVPVVIKKTTNKESLELAIVENIQRVDLNCVDESLGYFRLMEEYDLTQEDLAKKMGKDRATIANSLRLLKLSDSILVYLRKGSLGAGHAKALLAIEDSITRDRVARQAVEQGWSVRQIEKTAQEIKLAKGQAPRKAAPIDPEMVRLNADLTRKFMAKVEIKGDQNSGMIAFQYKTRAELERLFESLMTGKQ